MYNSDIIMHKYIRELASFIIVVVVAFCTSTIYDEYVMNEKTNQTKEENLWR